MALASLTLLLLAPAPASALSWAIQFTGFSFPSFVVIGNGQAYTGVTGIGYGWGVAFEIDTIGGATIKEWRIWPKLSVEGQDILNLKTHGFRAVYPNASDPWPRPTHVNKDIEGLFPDVVIRDYVVLACNRNAQKLRQQGQSNAQIFGQRHVIPATANPGYEVDSNVGKEKGSESFPPSSVEIVCEKWAGVAVPPKTDDLAIGMEVKQAQLVLFPSQHAGACPVQLNLFGKVTGNSFGSFESWVESTEGWKSTKTVRKIDSKVNGQYQEEFTEKVTVPIVQPTGSSGGGPAGGQAAGGGNLASPKLPVDPIPGQGKPPVSPSAGLTTGRPSNVHQAALRVVAVAGGKTVMSGWQDYKVACDPKVAPGLTPIDVLSAEVHVTQTSLAVKPHANPLGKCEVELKGKIWTNVAYAEVTLAYRNHKGVTTPPRQVTTGPNKEVAFTDTLDFSKAAGGLWIEQGGVIGPGGGQAGPYAGSFQIVGQSVPFESSPAPYSFTCTNQAPGGIVANPGTPKTNFPAVGPLTTAPRAPETGRQSGQGGGQNLTLGQGGPKPAPQIATLARVDFAAVVLALVPAGPQAVMLTGRFTNLGNAPGTGEYRVQVKNLQGQVVFEKSGRAQLDPGEQHGVSERIPAVRGQRLTATLSVAVAGDADAANNQKVASAVIP